MRYKILLLVVGLDVGGTETHVLELATRLDRRRFDVTVCSLKGSGRLGLELERRGVRVVTLDGCGKGDGRILFRLWRFVRRERPHVIHAFLFWANLAARLVGRLSGSCIVLSSYHDEVATEGWIIRTMDRITLRWTEALVCCSQAVSRSVADRIGGSSRRTVIIPFGVDLVNFKAIGPLERAALGLRTHCPVIGTVCRLVEPKKGLRILLEAVAEIQRNAPAVDCQVLIVGDGPAKGRLEALSRELGLGDSVVFAGERRDVPHILPVLDLFVLPSLYEGFGIAILEAMAAARPVVATTVGGIGEFVEHGQSGLLVEPGNPIALANAIQAVLRRPDRGREMGLWGRERVRKSFGIQSIVGQHERLYEDYLVKNGAWSLMGGAGGAWASSAQG
ncbi:MAG: glycosyltransferase [Nitrospiraceae bacterium]